MPSCRVCHAESEVDRFGRCRLCTVALAASKAGVHYGAYMALAGYHDDFRPVAGENGGQKCAWCGKLFFPRDRRQKYCEYECYHQSYLAKERERSRKKS